MKDEPRECKLRFDRTNSNLSFSLFIASLVMKKINLNSLYRIYEHRRTPSETIFIGLFQRCENRLIDISPDNNKIYPLCDENKYLPDNKNLSGLINTLQPDQAARLCNVAGNPYRCDYSPIAKGLISCTIISACTLALSLLFIYSHLLINQFKYKTHLSIAILTISLLFIAFVFILITLILLGSTMSYDLFEYRYNFNYRLLQQSMLGD
jgi:hypothetical protein